MTGTLIRVGWLVLRRDPLALVLTLVLPIAFFSVFAVVFRGVTTGAERPVAVALVDEDDTARSRRLVALLRADPALAPRADDEPIDAERARAAVARGRLPAAIVVRRGFASAFPPTATTPPFVDVLTDGSHPIAGRVGWAAVQSAAVRLGLEGLGLAGGAGDVVRVVEVAGASGADPSIAYFAAGIGVLFLLFAVSGRAAILIEERESGVLGRLLASGTGMGRVLLARWLFLTAVGTVQVTLMFVWAAIGFGLDLWTPRHLAGFAVLTPVTAASAAAFGLVLATACRTRAQLNGVASVVILLMSALGGSMFPRFLMPPELRTIGLATFNAWALDGYRKVFWYDLGPAAIVPQVAVLAASCAVFLGVARALAARRERE